MEQSKNIKLKLPLLTIKILITINTLRFRWKIKIISAFPESHIPNLENINISTHFTNENMIEDNRINNEIMGTTMMSVSLLIIYINTAL